VLFEFTNMAAEYAPLVPIRRVFLFLVMSEAWMWKCCPRRTIANGGSVMQTLGE
jgi:hypothetical protein